jgi:2'-5' RNA ligase
VVWLGVQGDLKPLEQLYHGVELATQPWSEETEARAFRPHLTLGRVRDPRSGGNRLMGERIQSISLPPLGEWRVERLDLMRSELSPKGAQHRLLVSVPLTGVASRGHFQEV